MEKVTVPGIVARKGKEKITMLTAYDFITAQIVDEAGVDIILVGDSVGNVILGYPNTIPVSITEMIHHGKAVVRAAKRALVVIDMPFMSYQESLEAAKRNAGRMIKESGAEAVKLEGGKRMKEVVRAIVDIDIPVMGHIGLTPQSIYALGSYKVQKERERLLEDALSLEEAGVFSIVLECVPLAIAREITERVKVPTIGIGAGPFCDGQVLVLHDLLGFYKEKRPKFVKTYCKMREEAEAAIRSFIQEVREGIFPDDSHSFH